MFFVVGSSTPAPAQVIPTTGKWYFEYSIARNGAGDIFMGLAALDWSVCSLADPIVNITTTPEDCSAVAIKCAIERYTSSRVVRAPFSVGTGVATAYTTSRDVAVAIDLDARKIWTGLPAASADPGYWNNGVTLTAEVEAGNEPSFTWSDTADTEICVAFMSNTPVTAGGDGATLRIAAADHLGDAPVGFTPGLPSNPAWNITDYSSGFSPTFSNSNKTFTYSEAATSTFAVRSYALFQIT